MPHIYIFEVNGVCQGMYTDKKNFKLDTASYILTKLVSDGYASDFTDAMNLTFEDSTIRHHVNSFLKEFKPFNYRGDRYTIQKKKANVMKEPEERSTGMINVNDPLPLVPITPFISDSSNPQ